MDDLVILKVKSINRYQRRLVAKEQRKIKDVLISLEFEFLDWLYNADKTLSYKFIYNYFLERFVLACDYLLCSAKYHEINKEYFVNRYKPVAQPIPRF